MFSGSFAKETCNLRHALHLRHPVSVSWLLHMCGIHMCVRHVTHIRVRHAVYGKKIHKRALQLMAILWKETFAYVWRVSFMRVCEACHSFAET